MTTSDSGEQGESPVRVARLSKVRTPVPGEGPRDFRRMGAALPVLTVLDAGNAQSR